MVTVEGEEIVDIIFFDIYLMCVFFPNNMLLLDFSPLYCCCTYDVCNRGVQILGARRSSCGMPTRFRRQLSSVNFTLVMIGHVVEYEL